MSTNAGESAVTRNADEMLSDDPQDSILNFMESLAKKPKLEEGRGAHPDNNEVHQDEKPVKEEDAEEAAIAVELDGTMDTELGDLVKAELANCKDDSPAALQWRSAEKDVRQHCPVPGCTQFYVRHRNLEQHIVNSHGSEHLDVRLIADHLSWHPSNLVNLSR